MLHTEFLGHFCILKVLAARSKSHLQAGDSAHDTYCLHFSLPRRQLSDRREQVMEVPLPNGRWLQAYGLQLLWGWGSMVSVPVKRWQGVGPKEEDRAAPQYIIK